MTTKVRELLSWVVLGTSEGASGSSTPKRLEPMVLVTPLPTKLEDFPWPVDTSSQVSAPDDAEMEDVSLEGIPTASSPTAKTPEPSSDAPPLDMAHLWEEANNTLGDLLAIKSSIDTHWLKLVSEFGMALCQNDSETAESMKEAKAICTHTIQEAKTHCSTAIKEAEAWRSSQAGSLQEETIKEESKGELNFLPACRAALQASPPKFHGALVASYHVLLGYVPMSHLFGISQGASPSQQGSAPGASSPPVPKHSPRHKQWHHSPDLMDVSPLDRTTSKANPKGPPSLKWQEVMPLHKVLIRSHQEAFGQDSSLVRKMREEYLRSHCPNFNNENSCDFRDVC